MERNGDGKDAIFVDTSIEIGKRIHSPLIQQSIRDRLAKFPMVITSLQVRNEFKRRVLGEAQYLLGQLELRKSYLEVKRHIESNLRERKRNICVQTLSTIFENTATTSSDWDAELTERAKLFLRDLLRFGMRTFDAQKHGIVSESGCVCATEPIKEKKPFLSYDFGIKKCSKAGSRCKIKEFLTENRDLLTAIADHISMLAVADKTEELAHAEQFIRDFLTNPEDVQSKNPCESIGDLLIALESKSVSTFYTMNVKESRHLCRILRQRLIYRHPNPDHDEVEFPVEHN